LRAIQITEQGDPDVLHLVDVATPTPGNGHILIKVQAASVNYADVMRRSGMPYPAPTPLPFVPGGEVAGTVAALGPNVLSPPVGTPVFAVVGTDGSGGYAEYALAQASQVIPIPPGISADQAAGIVIAGTTAALLLTRTANFKPGQSVFVPAAAGGVGSYAIQIAKQLGAGTVIAAASSKAKRDTALELGADHAIDPKPGWHEQVREITAGAGVDVALECSGGHDLGEAVRSLAPFGTSVVYGMTSGAAGVIDPTTWTELLYSPALNQSILTFNLGLWFQLRPDPSIEALITLVDWIANGRIATPTIHAMPLAEARTAHEMLQSRRSEGKIVLRP
jgi:NADPH:quinone reductase